jgi:putative ABC transport system permease protein
MRPVFDFVGNAYLPGSGDFAIPTGFGVRRGLPLVVLDKTKVAEGLRHIDDVWRRLNPIEPPRHEFTDETFQRSYAFYSTLGTALTLTGSIALLVSLLGALGFALFAGEQRAHEIGVRKTLGASAERILTMLLRDFSKPIVIANLLAWPLAYLAVQKYLSLFLERVELTLLPFVVSLAISLIVVWLAIGKQVYRAARMNPATVLRHE